MGFVVGVDSLNQLKQIKNTHQRKKFNHNYQKYRIHEKKSLTQETGRKKILLFGSNGMLGHKILQNLPFEFEIIGTVKKKNAKFKNFIFIENINVKNFKKLKT